MINRPERDQNQIDLFISPRFLLFSASLCIDCVRLCNREQPDNPLAIRLLSEKGGSISASNGVALQTDAITCKDSAGTVMVLTSYEPEFACTPAVIDWLREQHRDGARMVCIETAAYVFVQAGIIETGSKNDEEKVTRQLAAHYEAVPAYREMFGEQISLEHLFNRNGTVYSSAGAMSTLDLMLYLIDELRSEELADRIAYVFNHERKPTSHRKPSRAEGAITRLDVRLGRIVELMEASIGAPKPLGDIYRLAGVEASTARRLFHRILNQSPKTYYRQLRVHYGRELLQNGALNVGQVADLTGYADASSFTRAYGQVFGFSPAKSKIAS